MSTLSYAVLHEPALGRLGDGRVGPARPQAQGRPTLAGRAPASIPGGTFRPWPSVRGGDLALGMISEVL